MITIIILILPLASIGLLEVVSYEKYIIFFIPIYIIHIIIVLIFIPMNIKELFYKKQFQKRYESIKKTVERIHEEKYINLNLQLKVGTLACWIEISHEVKNNDLYIEYVAYRGFPTDSDLSPSNCAKSTQKIKKNRVPDADSWDCLNQSKNIFYENSYDVGPISIDQSPVTKFNILDKL